MRRMVLMVFVTLVDPEVMVPWKIHRPFTTAHIATIIYLPCPKWLVPSVYDNIVSGDHH